MSENTQANQTDENAELSNLPKLKFPVAKSAPDLATILGLFFAISLIILAIVMSGEGNSQLFNFTALSGFFNGQSILIVILGTIAATSISFTGEELKGAGGVIKKTIIGSNLDPQELSKSLLDTSVIAKKKGILYLSQQEKELSKDPFLKKSMQMVIDGYSANDVEFFLSQEIEAEIERHKRSANMCRRASEVAPAMGLIGTLVGLVMMLSNLETPETIGPSMAIALLTTFYGAILGTVIMAPLAVKLEKRASDLALNNTLIQTTCVSIANQDNPRKLEMSLNAELPPGKRIRYFD